MGRRPSGDWLRCAAWQTVAHGADTVVFFRWRTAAHGTEQYWHGAINHDGKPRRRYAEMREFGHELRAMSTVLDTTVTHSDVAIVNSYEQHFALDIQPQADGLGIWDQISRYYRALKKQGVNVDIVPLSVDLNRYKLVLAPSWHVMTEADAARLTNYTRQGGTLLVSPRTGVKDQRNACWTEPLPALIRDVVGVEVDDYDPLGEDSVHICTADGQTFSASVWADTLLLQGADAIAHYSDGLYAHEPAMARNHFGDGVAYYLGTFAEPALYDTLFSEILDSAGITNRMPVPETVDVAWRESDRETFLFVINFEANDCTLRGMPAGSALIGPKIDDGVVTLPGHAVGIYGIPKTISEKKSLPSKKKRATA
jgi:beta-galactosidase